MIRIINLGSSSQGNCTLYQHDDTKILVDAGLSGKQIELRLYEVGVDPRSITAILLTHEHNDHCQGVKTFRKKFPGIKVFTNHATMLAISRGHGYNGFDLFRTGGYFKINDVVVGSMRVPHSAAEAVGFELHLVSMTAIHLTDLGYVDSQIVQRIAHADVVLIESNYDPGMLAQNESLRPFDTHKRNQGRTGHLANQETAQALLRAKDFHVDLYGGSFDARIGLLHLSRQFNTPELALGTVRGICELEDIRVTNGDRPTVIFEA